LRIIEVSHEWTRLFGEAGDTLFAWLGQSLIVDFQKWIQELATDVVLKGWTAEKAKHQFRRVVCRQPNGSKLAMMILLTMLDPGDQDKEMEKKYFATLSAERVAEKVRRISSKSSNHSSNSSRSSRSSKRGPPLAPVAEVEVDEEDCGEHVRRRCVPDCT